MPAMHFRVRWPDESESNCYSPSLVIKDFFVPGTAYPLPSFLDSVREALNIASERVRAKYGYACSAAMDQLNQIEQIATRFADVPEATVHMLEFDEHG